MESFKDNRCIFNTGLNEKTMIVSILIVYALAVIFGNLFSYLKMPKVVGEIFGGFLLGPTCLGFLMPNSFLVGQLATNTDLLNQLSWIGLGLLMFCSGFEMDNKFNAKDAKIIVALVLGTTLIPSLFGWVSTSFFDLSKIIGTANNHLALKLIITVGVAVTSIPVISKIFLDLGIIKTRFAKICLSVATIHDLLLWILVSVAVGMVSAGVSTYKFLSPHFIFGAFLAGIILGFIPKTSRIKKTVKNFSVWTFVPIYFAVVGMKLNLLSGFDPMFFVVFTLFAIAAQTIAVFTTTHFLGFNRLESFNLAVVLNDRGGPCIVLATLALSSGIINSNFFVTLVLLAVITSLTAGIWLRFVLSKKWPLLRENI